MNAPSRVRIASKLTSLQDVLDAKPDTVWYSSRTCWWTTNPDHLEETRIGRGDSKGSIPTDPAGAPLFMTNNVEGFLKDAADHADHYGKHGIDAFMLAYHGNVENEDGMPRCSTQWDQYNQLLDQRELWSKLTKRMIIKEAPNA